MFTLYLNIETKLWQCNPCNSSDYKCMKDMLSFNVHVSYKPIAKLCHLLANFKDNDESKNRQQVVFRINWSNRDSVGIQAFFVPS